MGNLLHICPHFFPLLLSFKFSAASVRDTIGGLKRGQSRSTQQQKKSNFAACINVTKPIDSFNRLCSGSECAQPHETKRNESLVTFQLFFLLHPAARSRSSLSWLQECFSACTQFFILNAGSLTQRKRFLLLAFVMIKAAKTYPFFRPSTS